MNHSATEFQCLVSLWCAEGMRSPMCAPAGLGFIERTFEGAPKPLPHTRLKLPQAGHMQFCRTGRTTPFWNVMCGCGKTSNDAVMHHAAALMTGYLLEGGYSSLSHVRTLQSEMGNLLLILKREPMKYMHAFIVILNEVVLQDQ